MKLSFSTKLRNFLVKYPLLVLLVVMVTFFQFSTGLQLNWGNLRSVLLDSALISLVAIPAAMLIISGYIDLSVGSILALGGVSAGLIVNAGAGDPFVAVLVAVGVGALVGLVNGTITVFFGFSAFIVTLGTLTAIRGVALLVSPYATNNFGDVYGFLGIGLIAGVPVAIWIAALAFIVAAVFMQLMPSGRHLYAIGVNREAAFLSGVNIKRIPFVLYILSGASAGLAGAIYAARLNSAPAGQMGLGFELVVLTAVLLGGVSLMGGEGTMFGVLIGVLFLGLLNNGLTLIGVASFWQNVASGVALIVAIGLSVVTHKVREKLQARENHKIANAVA